MDASETTSLIAPGFDKPAEEAASIEGTEHKEAGYIIAMTALMLVPLLVMAAFAVDVGSWYADSARLQRAADAAALASVVYMPDQDVAWAVALEVAEQNGFKSNYGVGDVFVGGGNSRLWFNGSGAIVNIKIDADGDLYFSEAFLSDVDLARVSQAEYIEEVRMGNPSSGLGTGNLTAASDVGSLPNDGFWLAINSSCEIRANGDQFVDQISGCSGTTNPIGRLPVAAGGAGWNGYTFVADMPAGATAAVLEVRNPGFCGNSFHGTNTSGSRQEPDLTAWVYGPDSTPLLASDVLDNPASLLTTVTWDGDVFNAACGWRTVANIPAPGATRKLWYARFQADGSNGDSVDMNTFSLRVRPTAETGLCSSLITSTCPQIYALDWLPIYRPGFEDPPGTPVTTAEFFLAEVPAYHEGKIFELTMFDPGEGMQEIRILDPDGNYAEFEWRTANNFVLEDAGTDGGFTNSGTGGCANSDHCLDVTGSVFNHDAIQLRMDLDGYTCQDTSPPAGSVNCWWKVEYYTTGSSGVTDRTNWSVRIIGDPIRLTE